MGSFESGDGVDCTGQLESYERSSDSGLRIAVLVTCTLSLIGSSIIILSYLCYKEHRTRARYILVHLSLCNIGQVISNSVGIAMDFNNSFGRNSNFEFPYDVLHGHNKSTAECICTAQAFVTVYFSLCAMLWTICLAVYLYLLILSMKQTYFTRYIVWMSYSLCYMLPLLVTVWLLLSQRLGYAPYSTPGYCGLMTRRPFQMSNGQRCDPERDVFGEFMGYDLWVILTVILTLLFYTSALCYLRQQHKEQISDSANFWATIQNIDYKFIAIPVAFALLRVWSLIMDLLFTYIAVDVDKGRKHHLVMSMLFLMGIGNSAQGFIDAVLFVAFTPTIRTNLLKLFLCCCTRKKRATKPTLLHNESKDFYANSLRNYRPRYSLSSSSPVTITSTRISASPESSTSYQESPEKAYTIQTEDYENRYAYY